MTAVTPCAFYLYGQQLPAGLGVSTVLASIDFETYSEAGYVWHPQLGKWQPLKKGKPGIKGVGAWRYTEHPSAEVLCLAYDLKDGLGRRLWHPGDPPPVELFEHITRGGLVEAVNSFFEFCVWVNICVPRMGWPPLPIEQIRDTAAKAGSATLPRKLEACAAALQTAARKDPEGHRVMLKVSKPRSPTKKDKRLRYAPADAPDDFARLYSYCLDDIAAEDDVSARLADLSPFETEVFLADQRINARGVYCDRAAVLAARRIIAQAAKRYHAELSQITGGAVGTADELDAMKAWLATRGVATPDGITKDSLPVLLARADLPPDVRRVLDIRVVMGSKSVTKTASMLFEMSEIDDRIRGLYTYAGACRTWRWAGGGAQPQNLPAGGPDVVRCTSCDAVRWSGLWFCPSCFTHGSRPAEWGIDAAEACLPAIMSGDLDTVELLWGDALTAIAGCLRSFLRAAPGNELISADLDSIEAVVAAFLAGEEWRMEVFRTHGKIYEMSASKSSGVPFEEFARHKRETGMHHPLRKKGKVAELACFTAETLVLTNRGYTRIADVQLGDELWDGIEWVEHAGVINKGERDVIDLDGTRVTPDHPISLRHSWKVASELVSNRNFLTRALEYGSENLPLSVQSAARVSASSSCSAHVGRQNTQSASQTFGAVRAPAALFAQNAKRLKASRCFGVMRTLCLKTTTVVAYVTASLLQLAAAITSGIKCSETTAAEASKCAKRGAIVRSHSWRTSAPWKAGTAQNSRWTASTSTEITKLGTSGSSPDVRTCSTNEVSARCRKNLTRCDTVYDIAHAGPRNRFTIKTDSGHLIVHNSGFGGWVDAWKNFGADEWMVDAEIEEGVKAWRRESPSIINFWYALEDAAIAAVDQPGSEHTVRGHVFFVRDDVLYCRLLSGRCIPYRAPRVRDGIWYGKAKRILSYLTPKHQTAWVRVDTRGAKTFENIVQATARDIFAGGMLRVEAAGYPVVLHTHDEVNVEVRVGSGSIEEVERLLSAGEPWCADWPIRATGGWRGIRYRKD
ncbi:MAG: hypothetical protein V3W41_14540 [Planctomycetota bacterium]